MREERNGTTESHTYSVITFSGLEYGCQRMSLSFLCLHSVPFFSLYSAPRTGNNMQRIYHVLKGCIQINHESARIQACGIKITTVKYLYTSSYVIRSVCFFYVIQNKWQIMNNIHAMCTTRRRKKTTYLFALMKWSNNVALSNCIHSLGIDLKLSTEMLSEKSCVHKNAMNHLISALCNERCRRHRRRRVHTKMRENQNEKRKRILPEACASFAWCFWCCCSCRRCCCEN